MVFQFKPNNHWNFVSKDVFKTLEAAGYDTEFLREVWSPEEIASAKLRAAEYSEWYLLSGQSETEA